MLDKHYSVVMTFDVLSKELFSLKQGSNKNVAEFRVHFLQQVEIFQSEYPRRIQLEHLEEMKCDHFYEDFNPEYRWMLVHKVDGNHPASYSNLLLAKQKLERLAEARDPLPPKTAATNGSTTMHSQMPGNLYPSCMLKGNCTFAAQAATVENDVVEEDLGVESWGQEDMEPSANEEVEILGKVKEADQSVE